MVRSIWLAARVKATHCLDLHRAMQSIVLNLAQMGAPKAAFMFESSAQYAGIMRIGFD